MKIALLANGPSLATHDLSRIAIDTMGMNRSWKLLNEPDYHMGIESVHYQTAPEYFERMADLGRLYVVGGGWPCGKRIKMGTGTFNKDVFADGVVTELNGVGSVFFASLQVAYSLGYREVFALGLDLAGPHFDGSPASPSVERQNAMFAYVPDDLKVWTCGSPESRAVFEKCGFEEVCG